MLSREPDTILFQLKLHRSHRGHGGLELLPTPFAEPFAAVIFLRLIQSMTGHEANGRGYCGTRRK